MASTIWQGLLANLALSAILLIIWDFLGFQVRGWRPVARTLVFGGIAALGLIGSMMQAVEILPNVFIDLRLPFLATASFFGGPIVALMVVTTAIAGRLYLGGFSISLGIFGFILTSAIGLALRIPAERRGPRYSDIALLAGLTALVVPAVALVLPAARWEIVASKVILPQMLTSLVGTLLIGFGLYHERQRRELFRSSETYRAMVEALPDSLNSKDCDGRFLVANAATAQLMRADGSKDLIGKTDADFYEPEIASQFHQDEAAVMKSGTTVRLDQQFIRRDGTGGWLSTLKTPLRDENGRLVGLITHNRDITEAKALQAELDSVNEKFEDALTFMAEGLVMFDAEGRIELRNERYTNLFPITADVRVPGSSFLDILKTAALRGEEFITTPDLDAWAKQRASELHTYRDRQFAMRDGRWLEARTRPVRNGRTLITIADITDSKQLEQRLEHEATHDALTGLANRAMFHTELKHRFDAAVKANEPVAVLLLDLDRFKEVNDTFGHAVGDMLLVEVARRAETALRDGDLVARLGGDEFAVLMSGPSVLRGAESLAERILSTLSRPLAFENIELLPHGSIGIAYYPKDADFEEDLMIQADRALYAAKAAGRGRFVAYSGDKPSDSRRSLRG